MKIAVRPARSSDVPGITACVCEAYLPYIERIGRQPAPMLEDYGEAVERKQVHVAVQGEAVIGVLVLSETDEGFCLDNVAVRTGVKGEGVGRMLLELAEAEASRRGFDSIYLCTNELMSENRALYRRIGYVEYDHRAVDGYTRAFFRKPLDVG